MGKGAEDEFRNQNFSWSDESDHTISHTEKGDELRYETLD